MNDSMTYVYETRSDRVMAVRYDGTNAAEIERVLGIEVIELNFFGPSLLFNASRRVDYHVFPGDYVVQYLSGDYGVYSADSFNRHYIELRR